MHRIPTYRLRLSEGVECRGSNPDPHTFTYTYHRTLLLSLSLSFSLSRAKRLPYGLHACIDVLRADVRSP